ncbi:MAG: (2Fe-2S)-binding protein [Chlorobium sp.]|nr:MAG: (2Fe-2S)-binding protein [Chlorobium sp.]
MNVIINHKEYEAKRGERLLDIARKNHAHIGYFCGGNAICQTCYVKVTEGGELLSPMSETEHAMLSPKLVEEGTRMACMTTVEKPGTVVILSAVEEVKEMVETNPLKLVDYAAKMGWESLVKFPDTMRLQAERKFDLWQILSDVFSGIVEAVQNTINAFIAPSAGNNECNCVQLLDTTKLLENIFNGNKLSECCPSNGHKKLAEATTNHITAHNEVLA